MLSKAYKNHYDIGILVGIDFDFLEIVRAVKNTGKNMVGVYVKFMSEELKNNFDKTIQLSSDVLEKNKLISFV